MLRCGSIAFLPAVLGVVIAQMGSLALTRQALASDGVRELSQAAAEASGFPLTLSTPGSYVLTSDLDVGGEASPLDATAIVVTADHVWIDLNGFSIVGPNTCSGSAPGASGTGDGIRATSQHVTVVGGTVRGMGRDGISLGDDARIEGVTVTCNGRDGVSAGVRSLAVSNHLTANAGFGLWIGADSAMGSNQIVGNDGGPISGGPLTQITPSSCGGGGTCTATCGDDVAELGETCDGTDLAGEDCTSQGFTGGTLQCDGDCMGFDTGLCTCDPTGSYASTPAASYSCAFGLVSYNVTSWGFTDIGGGQMTVSGQGLPGVLTGTLVSCGAGNGFSVSLVAAGGCTETYTLTGTFSDTNNWSGTFTSDFTGGCFDCTNQSVPLSGSR